MGCLALAACEGRDVTEVRFEDAPATPDDALLVDAASAADARTRLLDALDAREGVPALVGGGDWHTRVMLREGDDVQGAAARGRTYVLTGESELRLDVRLGAGDRGAFQGGTVDTGAERAMLQIKLEDPGVLGARFRISIVADDGPGEAHPRDVTPAYLARPVPRGRYRAWVDVPPRGGRYLVAVAVLDRSGRVVAHAWSSPIAVVRPWL